MKKELQYALVTSSALPQEVASSRYYTELDKTQWLDLIDYSEELVKTDKDQEVLFLIVAKGTEDQIAEDEERRQERERKKLELQQSNTQLSTNLGSLTQEKEDLATQISHLSAELKQLKDREVAEEEAEKSAAEEVLEQKKQLRQRSVSLFNALYSK